MIKTIFAIFSVIISLTMLACTADTGGSTNPANTSDEVDSIQSSATAADRAPPFWTNEHRDVLQLVNGLLLEPEVESAKQKIIEMYSNSPSGSIADGEATLESAVDSLMYGALLASASKNLADAKIVWSETLAYDYAGVEVPDNRYAGETPDRIYRNVVLSSDYRYELHGKYDAEINQDFSVEVIPGPANWGLPPLAVLRAKNIILEADGSFKITLDADPAGDRVNHLQLTAKAKGLLIRDTVGDWALNKPVTISLVSLDADKGVDLTKQEIVDRAVGTLQDAVRVSLMFYGGIWKRELNQLTTYVRDLGWGIVGLNRFSIADDEALVVTIDSLGAEYFGIQVDDLWLRSVDYYQYASTMNLKQSRANPDGSYTYVISSKDPGHINWIDTGGLNDGYLVARWELFPQITDGSGAVKSVQKVKLSELKGALAEASVFVSHKERAQLLNDRRNKLNLRMGK